jgi:hypothetical protein
VNDIEGAMFANVANDLPHRRDVAGIDRPAHRDDGVPQPLNRDEAVRKGSVHAASGIQQVYLAPARDQAF